MEYKKINGEEILNCITAMCENEKIFGGHFQGIGACGEVALSTYLPEKKDFTMHSFSGMLEMTSLLGNVTKNLDDKISLHAHANFSYLNGDDIIVIGGHLKSAVVSYTAEIILRPANEIISQRFDIVDSVGVWNFQR